jgi:hypothetical protein
MNDLLSGVDDLLHLCKLRDPGAVLISSLERDGVARFRAGVRHASTHPYLVRGHVWTSPVVVSELLRQASVAVVRRALDVPPENDYALTTMSLELPPHPIRAGAGDAVRPVAIELAIVNSATRDGMLTQADMEVVLRNDDGTAARCRLGGRFFPLAVYQRVREASRAAFLAAPRGEAAVAAPVAPAIAEVAQPEEVLVTVPERRDGGFVSALLGAAGHPYFHHNVKVPDHVPGAMMIEAAVQATLAVARLGLGRAEPAVARVTRLSAGIARFVELDGPAALVCEPRDGGGGHLESTVRVEQAGQVCATLELTLAP